jgi:SAM-dependent methyltransferase
MPYDSNVFSQLVERLSPAIAQWIRVRKMRSRVRGRRSEPLNRVLASVERTADLDRIHGLRRKMRPAYRADPAGAAKYADHRFWLLLNIDRAARLGLHTASALHILDLGCGPGYFMAAARALGHDCRGADIPESCFTPVEREVYAELLGALKCRPHVSPLLIERFVPLPFEAARFDLITAFWICFNRHRQLDEWGVEEWRFFVDDALRCLREGGRLFLELNEHAERYAELRWYDTATHAYFRSVGTVDRNCVTITRSA